MLSLATFNIIVLSWIGIGLITFPFLFKITAPYGRHSNRNWGPMINNRLGWIIMEFPAMALFATLVISGGGLLRDNIIMIAFGLWMIHYINRTLIFPLRLRTKGKKMPILIVGMAFFFNLVNGFVNGYWFGTLSPGYSADWFYDPRFIIGIILFATGWFINQYHDNLLINLRKKSDIGYQIPYGGLFKYVSTPNLFGEIIEWGGFALLTWCLPSFSFFIWTFVNLVPRAVDHHKWYKEKFEDYPASRKAVFPFIF